MRKVYTYFAFVVMALFSSTACVFANSSWHWISETRPFDVLPWVIVLTLAVEMTVLCKCVKGNYLKVCIVVLLANLLSFIAPYLLDGIGMQNSVGYDFEQFLNHTPSWIIGMSYGLLTLLVEVPILCKAFGEKAEDEKFFRKVVLVNILTTVMVFVIERIVCEGAW